MVFDLDPYIYSGNEAKGDEPEYNKRGWEKTVEIALSLKELLDQLALLVLRQDHRQDRPPRLLPRPAPLRLRRDPRR